MTDEQAQAIAALVALGMDQHAAATVVAEVSAQPKVDPDSPAAAFANYFAATVDRPAGADLLDAIAHDHQEADPDA